MVGMIHDLGEIIVCAPDTGRSGYGCAFSAVSPLQLKRQEDIESAKVWSCNGTPVDCVKIALVELCGGRKPDMVVGGINHGDNASVNTHYSGTMGVTMEGCIKRIPSVAFSICNHSEDADFGPLHESVRKIVKNVLEKRLPDGICLNVNYPVAETFKGVKICRMARGNWGNEIAKQRHPRGYDYYWMVGSYTNEEPENTDTDNWALKNGFIAITPTRVDVTADEFMDHVQDWNV